MIGCFDTKAEDFGYLHQCLTEFGADVISINTGIRGNTDAFDVTIEAEEVAKAGGADLQILNDANDRGNAIEVMGQGAALIIANLFSAGKVHGAIGMGGGGGTYIALAAMQSLPIGIPKLCVSTVASKDLSIQIGSKDITLMPSIVDVAGLNKISRVLIKQAAGAICGMVHAGSVKNSESKGTIAISIFGNTTECVDHCSELLKQKGYEVLTFHAVGVGGKTMESLVRDGYIDAVLDITTTELADELCGGICSAGPDRLTAASAMNIPQVVVPGCLDMVNFGSMASVPAQYKDRLLYSWAPDVTLMRTNREENKALGEIIANKLNTSKGKVSVILPTAGISKISTEGGIFHAPELDQILFDTIRNNVRKDISIHEISANINDIKFSEMAVNQLLMLIDDQKS